MNTMLHRIRQLLGLALLVTPLAWAVSFTGPDMIVWMVTACVVACAIAFMPLPPGWSAAAK